MGKHAEALDEFDEARKLSAQLDDAQGVAFADLHICDARVELGQLGNARAACRAALLTFIASKFWDQMKETQALLARIDLAEGHPEKALATLNEVLDHGGTDVLPRRVADLYQWRARTNAALGITTATPTRPGRVPAPLHRDQRRRSQQASCGAARALRDRP